MTRADALRALLAKVEAGEWWECPDFLPTTALDAFHGSLDAAKALHEAVLPGWRLSISQPEIPEIGITFTAIVWPSERGTREHYFRPYAESETPARAWLIAILKALIATEDN